MRYFIAFFIFLVALITCFYLYDIYLYNTSNGMLLSAPKTQAIVPEPDFICKHSRKCYAYKVSTCKSDKKSPIVLYFHGWHPFTKQTLLEKVYTEFITPLKQYNVSAQAAPIVVILNGSVAPGPRALQAAPYRGWNLANPNQKGIENYGTGYGTGFGFNAETIPTCLSTMSEQAGWFYPNQSVTKCINNTKASFVCQWTGCRNEMQYVDSVIKEVRHHFPCADTNKIYAVGFSNGAMFSYILPSVLNKAKGSYSIAAIASYSGGIPYGLFVPDSLPPFIDFHGRQDYTVPGKTSRQSLTGVCRNQLSKLQNTQPNILALLKNKTQKEFQLTRQLTDDDLFNQYLSCDNVKTYQIVYNIEKLFEFATGQQIKEVALSKLNQWFPALKNPEIWKYYSQYQYSTYWFDSNHVLVEFNGAHQLPVPHNLGVQMTWDFLSRY